MPKTKSNFSVLSKKYFYNPGVMKKVSSLSVTGDSPFNFMVDGEIIEDVTTVEVKISESKIRCFVNGKAKP